MAANVNLYDLNYLGDKPGVQLEVCSHSVFCHKMHSNSAYLLNTPARSDPSSGPVDLFPMTLALRHCLSLLCGQRSISDPWCNRLKRYTVLSYAVHTPSTRAQCGCSVHSSLIMGYIHCGHKRRGRGIKSPPRSSVTKVDNKIDIKRTLKWEGLLLLMASYVYRI